MTTKSDGGAQVSTHTQTQESETGEVTKDESEEESNSDKKHRLNPMVVQKLREIVAGGEVRVYHVRRLLRYTFQNKTFAKFVSKTHPSFDLDSTIYHI